MSNNNGIRASDLRSKSTTLKEGWLLKQGGFVKNWKQRYFILNSGVCYYFTDPDANSPQGSFSLAGAKVYRTSEGNRQHILKVLL